MIIGIHKRQNDLVVNPTKAKQLTNIRAAGTDENLMLTPPLNYSLEQSLEFLDDDELLEVTPDKPAAAQEAPDGDRPQTGIAPESVVSDRGHAGVRRPAARGYPRNAGRDGISL